jgi:hypothetical protein
VFPAAFAVVIFMTALVFVGMHESSARALSGLIKKVAAFRGSISFSNLAQ